MTPHHLIIGISIAVALPSLYVLAALVVSGRVSRQRGE